jgi:hypothetical protein
MMSLESLLQQKKSAIVARWYDSIIESYPPDTAKFLRRQKDRFANPVAYALSEGIEGLFDELLRGIDPDRVSPFLDKIIRIRAIQEFSPSQSVAFVFLLKNVIRGELKSDIRAEPASEELLLFEARIDELALLAFDIYMQCREKIYQIKADDVRRMTFNLLRRAKMICELPEEEPDQGDNDNAI